MTVWPLAADRMDLEGCGPPGFPATREALPGRRGADFLPHNHSHADHHHHHGHGMNAADFGKAFAAGIVLNLGFVAVETVYGFAANSMALLADAGHNLADVLALATAWGGAILAKRPPTRRFSYGLRAASILAALFN